MSVKQYKIQITHPSLWYISSVGAVLEVIDREGSFYDVTDREFYKVAHLFPKAIGLYIYKGDCRIINEVL